MLQIVCLRIAINVVIGNRWIPSSRRGHNNGLEGSRAQDDILCVRFGNNGRLVAKDTMRTVATAISKTGFVFA